MFTRKLISAAMVAGLVFTSSSVLASGSKSYEVTITNLTNAIIFTPILVASHKKGVSLFELGTPASAGLTAIAEGGDIAPLTAYLETMDDVDVGDSGGPLLPGDSVTVIVSAGKGAKNISVASMMLPTNDGFIALNGVKAPKKGTAIYYSPGYDAGTELNDELCAHIPGPPCFGMGLSPIVNGDEGYVHIHRGMHGSDELDAAVYDWRNPVARITVTRTDDDD